MLQWLRKLLGKTATRSDKSLLDIARDIDSEKTRRVLAKKPIKPPSEVLADVLTASLENPLAPRPKAGQTKPNPAKPAGTLVDVMNAEATAQARLRPHASTPKSPEAAPEKLVDLVHIPPPLRPRPPPDPAAAPNAPTLVQAITATEAAILRRNRPHQAPPAASAPLPVEAWSKKQQDDATRGKPPPTAPDNSKLHAALSKEDTLLRAMSAKSNAAKDAAKTPKK